MCSWTVFSQPQSPLSNREADFEGANRGSAECPDSARLGAPSEHGLLNGKKGHFDDRKYYSKAELFPVFGS